MNQDISLNQSPNNEKQVAEIEKIEHFFQSSYIPAIDISEDDLLLFDFFNEEPVQNNQISLHDTHESININYHQHTDQPDNTNIMHEKIKEHLQSHGNFFTVTLYNHQLNKQVNVFYPTNYKKNHAAENVKTIKNNLKCGNFSCGVERANLEILISHMITYNHFICAACHELIIDNNAPRKKIPPKRLKRKQSKRTPYHTKVRNNDIIKKNIAKHLDTHDNFFTITVHNNSEQKIEQILNQTSYIQKNHLENVTILNNNLTCSCQKKTYTSRNALITHMIQSKHFTCPKCEQPIETNVHDNGITT